MIEQCVMLSGQLKTGAVQIHQELHIDDADLIENGGILEKVVHGDLDQIKAREWLEAGYVVDMPLSDGPQNCITPGSDVEFLIPVNDSDFLGKMSLCPRILGGRWSSLPCHCLAWSD